MRALRVFSLSVISIPLSVAVARAQPDSPAPAAPAAETAPPAPGEAAPSPEQQGPNVIVEPAPAPAPTEQAPPSPPPVNTSPPPSPPPPPANVAAATTVPPDTAARATPVGEPLPARLALGIEPDAGMVAGGRFPQNEAGRTVEEAIDSTFGAAVWLGSRRLVVGFSAERTGLGKDHYATNANAETMEASYAVDTFSVLGRWYFADVRPAFYLGLSVGAALPTEHTIGTHAADGVFVTPGESYACSASGTVGATAALTAGVEFEVAPGLSLLADARAAGFFMSRSANAFGGCAPGTGPAAIGAIRLGASYRFGL